jgi:hypothetical protein
LTASGQPRQQRRRRSSQTCRCGTACDLVCRRAQGGGGEQQCKGSPAVCVCGGGERRDVHRHAGAMLHVMLCVFRGGDKQERKGSPAKGWGGGEQATKATACITGQL